MQNQEGRITFKYYLTNIGSLEDRLFFGMKVLKSILDRIRHIEVNKYET